MNKIKNFMNNFGKGLREVFSDETNRLSSKRIVGTLASLSLIVVYFLSFYNNQYTVNESLSDSLLALAIFCFGASSFDKFSLYKLTNKDKYKPKDQNDQNDQTNSSDTVQ
jgi:cellobiose-specific phosphotransferase system component IIC